LKHHHHTAQSARFGTVLGIAPGDVPVYSSDYETADRTELPNRQAYRSYVDGVYMGHKWQCVELARRWMYLNEGYIFDDIAMAYDIFQLRHVRRVADDALLPLRSFRNGAKRPPAPGALMIWREGGEFDVTGHVAVVTEVLADRVRCVEQNVDHEVWPEGRNWARELPMRVDDSGGHWVSCTFPDTDILGWVIQTDDDAHAETIVDPDPRLFRPVLHEVPARGQADAAWLDTGDAVQGAYVEMMGGCRLVADDADQHRYFAISETAYRELRRATNELHRMFLLATDYVLQDDDRLRPFNLPPALWSRIHQSWNNRRTQMISGRFDFSLSERGLKVYEYNADSASCHMECGFVQGRWAEHFGCGAGWSAGEDLFEGLVEAWEESSVDDILHIMRDDDLEEAYHALYMKSAAETAGIRCKIISGTEGLQWGADGQVLDADGAPIKWVWKTWAWETALDEIRHQLDDDEEKLRLQRTIDRTTTPPRLVDVLLREEVMVFEPLWTLIPSNKAILPVLHNMFPNLRYLLNSGYELTDELRATGYVAKPIVGRCGENIAIFDRHEELVHETSGKFEARDQIYQELFGLPKIDGRNVQLGTFSVAGTYGGACVRDDVSPIITSDSDMFPLRIVPDDEFLAGLDAQAR
jgi:glutathionylspermidine amidase/synthetase